MALQTRCLKCSISSTFWQSLMLWNHKNILLFLISKPLFMQKWIPLFCTFSRCSLERQCHQFWNLWRSGMMIFTACLNWTAINTCEIVAYLNKFYTNVLMICINNFFTVQINLKMATVSFKWMTFFYSKWPQASLEIKICFSNIIDKY